MFSPSPSQSQAYRISCVSAELVDDQKWKLFLAPNHHYSTADGEGKERMLLGTELYRSLWREAGKLVDEHAV